MNPFCIDHHDDGIVEYDTHWMVEPPEPGTGFIVLRDEWSADWTIRTIYEYRLGGAEHRRDVEE